MPGLQQLCAGWIAGIASERDAFEEPRLAFLAEHAADQAERISCRSILGESQFMRYGFLNVVENHDVEFDRESGKFLLAIVASGSYRQAVVNGRRHDSTRYT